MKKGIKQLLTISLIILAIVAITIPVKAATNNLKENVESGSNKDTYQIKDGTIVIGKSKFTPGVVVTGEKAAIAGANDLAIYLSENNNKSIKDYTYPKMYTYTFGEWYEYVNGKATKKVSPKLPMSIWYVDNVLKKGQQAPELEKPAEPVTKYNVFFVSGEEQKILSSKEVEKGKTVGTVTMPTRENYELTGWVMATPDGKVKDVSIDDVKNQVITQDTVFFAKWMEVIDVDKYILGTIENNANRTDFTIVQDGENITFGIVNGDQSIAAIAGTGVINAIEEALKRPGIEYINVTYTKDAVQVTKTFSKGTNVYQQAVEMIADLTGKSVDGEGLASITLNDLANKSFKAEVKINEETAKFANKEGTSTPQTGKYTVTFAVLEKVNSDKQITEALKDYTQRDDFKLFFDETSGKVTFKVAKDQELISTGVEGTRTTLMAKLMTALQDEKVQKVVVTFNGTPYEFKDATQLVQKVKDLIAEVTGKTYDDATLEDLVGNSLGVQIVLDPTKAVFADGQDGKYTVEFIELEKVDVNEYIDNVLAELPGASRDDFTVTFTPSAEEVDGTVNFGIVNDTEPISSITGTGIPSAIVQALTDKKIKEIKVSCNGTTVTLNNETLTSGEATKKVADEIKKLIKEVTGKEYGNEDPKLSDLLNGSVGKKELEVEITLNSDEARFVEGQNGKYKITFSKVEKVNSDEEISKKLKELGYDKEDDASARKDFRLFFDGKTENVNMVIIKKDEKISEGIEGSKTGLLGAVMAGLNDDKVEKVVVTFDGTPYEFKDITDIVLQVKELIAKVAGTSTYEEATLGDLVNKTLDVQIVLDPTKAVFEDGQDGKYTVTFTEPNEVEIEKYITEALENYKTKTELNKQFTMSQNEGNITVDILDGDTSISAIKGTGLIEEMLKALTEQEGVNGFSIDYDDGLEPDESPYEFDLKNATAQSIKDSAKALLNKILGDNKYETATLDELKGKSLTITPILDPEIAVLKEGEKESYTVKFEKIVNVETTTKALLEKVKDTYEVTYGEETNEHEVTLKMKNRQTKLTEVLAKVMTDLTSLYGDFSKISVTYKEAEPSKVDALEITQQGGNTQKLSEWLVKVLGENKTLESATNGDLVGKEFEIKITLANGVKQENNKNEETYTVKFESDPEVKFNLGEGTPTNAPTPELVEPGENAVKPTKAPSKVDDTGRKYQFKRWVDAESGEEYTFEEPVLKDVELTAEWYKVFNADEKIEKALGDGEGKIEEKGFSTKVDNSGENDKITISVKNASGAKVSDLLTNTALSKVFKTGLSNEEVEKIQITYNTKTYDFYIDDEHEDNNDAITNLFTALTTQPQTVSRTSTISEDLDSLTFSGLIGKTITVKAVLNAETAVWDEANKSDTFEIRFMNWVDIENLAKTYAAKVKLYKVTPQGNTLTIGWNLDRAADPKPMDDQTFSAPITSGIGFLGGKGTGLNDALGKFLKEDKIKSFKLIVNDVESKSEITESNYISVASDLLGDFNEVLNKVGIDKDTITHRQFYEKRELFSIKIKINYKEGYSADFDTFDVIIGGYDPSFVLTD